MLTYQVHPRNSKHCAQTTFVPCLIIMVTIPIVSLASMNFLIVLKHFVNTRPLVVEPILLYPWIMVPLVNQNRDFDPTIVIPSPDV